MGEFNKALQSLRKLGLVVVIGTKSKFDKDVIYIDYHHQEDNSEHIAGRDVRFIMVSPELVLSRALDSDIFLYTASRIRSKNLIQYYLDDGTLIVEGKVD